MRDGRQPLYKNVKVVDGSDEMLKNNSRIPDFPTIPLRPIPFHENTGVMHGKK